MVLYLEFKSIPVVRTRSVVDQGPGPSLEGTAVILLSLLLRGAMAIGGGCVFVAAGGGRPKVPVGHWGGEDVAASPRSRGDVLDDRDGKKKVAKISLDFCTHILLRDVSSPATGARQPRRTAPSANLLSRRRRRSEAAGAAAAAP